MAKSTKKAAKRRHECNGSFCFHGAFKDKAKAIAKAKKVHGWILFRGRGRGDWRHIVVTTDKSGVPF